MGWGSTMKYPEAEDGEWFAPKHRAFKHACCGCHLVHKVDFKIDEKGDIWMRWKRDNRATAAARRSLKFLPKEDEND